MKKALLSVVQKFGLEVRRRLPEDVDHGYQAILPSATYSPWLVDKDFLRIYDSISKNTLLDRYRLYELWSLVQSVSRVEGDILEVGVWRGGSSALLAKKASLLGLICNVYACDTFEGVVKAGKNDPDYIGGEHSDVNYTGVLSFFSGLGLNNLEVLKGIFPDDTGAQVQGNKFRLIHIDVDVHESAHGVFDFAWPRLSVGGVVVFDDYGFSTTRGIRLAVDELRDSTPHCTMIHNLNGHGLLIKTA